MFSGLLSFAPFGQAVKRAADITVKPSNAANAAVPFLLKSPALRIKFFCFIVFYPLRLCPPANIIDKAGVRFYLYESGFILPQSVFSK